MKKRIFLSLILINIIFYSFNVWAAKDEKEFGVHVRTKYGVKDVVEGSVDTETGEHVVKLEEGKLVNLWRCKIAAPPVRALWVICQSQSVSQN